MPRSEHTTRRVAISTAAILAVVGAALFARRHDASSSFAPSQSRSEASLDPADPAEEPEGRIGSLSSSTSHSGPASNSDRREMAPTTRVDSDAGVESPTIPSATPSPSVDSLMIAPTVAHDVDTGTATTAAPPDDASRSPRTDARGNVTIENTCSVDLELFWRDFEGQERSYGTIRVGRTRTQFTFERHAWALRTTDTHTLVREFVTHGSMVVDACDEGDPMRADPTEFHDASVDAPRVCSTGSTFAMTLTVTNACARPIQLEWVDFDCALVPYGRVPPGASARQNTYAGHIWHAVDDEHRVVGEIVADVDHDHFVVACDRDAVAR